MLDADLFEGLTAVLCFHVGFLNVVPEHLDVFRVFGSRSSVQTVQVWALVKQFLGLTFQEIVYMGKLLADPQSHSLEDPVRLERL